jgi:hypothetical protein
MDSNVRCQPALCTKKAVIEYFNPPKSFVMSEGQIIELQAVTARKDVE